MADKAALKAAGCPEEHCELAAAVGCTPQQVKDLNAKGFDWSKVAQLVQLILAMLAKTPQPT